MSSDSEVRLLLVTNRKSHMVSVSMTLNDCDVPF